MNLMPSTPRHADPSDASNRRVVETDRRNSFDAIRMFAAFCVFFSHELGMAGYVEPTLGPLGITLSSTGLYIFFGLSGYLVFRSLLRDPRPLRFIQARLLRIYPGWIVSMVFCVLLGAAVTTVPQAEFWRDPLTRHYLLHNVPILTTPTEFLLPGVFGTARWSAVNGSIWTVKYELLCYGLILGLSGLAAALRVRRAALLAIVTAGLVAVYIHHIATTPNPDSAVFFARYNDFNLIRFFMTFLAGSLYAACEPLSERARLLFLLVPAGLVTLGLSPDFARAGIVLLLTLAVIELGKSPLLFSRAYRRVGDLSYGTYLYAYPVQNLVTSRLFDGQNLSLVVAVSLVLILGLAYLSWRFVERPCLALKARP